jgi:hypothetical protein
MRRVPTAPETSCNSARLAWWLTVLVVGLVTVGCFESGSTRIGTENEAAKMPLACARRVIDGQRCLFCANADGGRIVGFSCDWSAPAAPQGGGR